MTAIRTEEDEAVNASRRLCSGRGSMSGVIGRKRNSQKGRKLPNDWAQLPAPRCPNKLTQKQRLLNERAGRCTGRVLAILQFDEHAPRQRTDAPKFAQWDVSDIIGILTVDVRAEIVPEREGSEGSGKLNARRTRPILQRSRPNRELRPRGAQVVLDQTADQLAAQARGGGCRWCLFFLKLASRPKKIHPFFVRGFSFVFRSQLKGAGDIRIDGGIEMWLV